MLTDILSVGHTVKRCKQPIPEGGGAGNAGFGDGGFGASSEFNSGAGPATAGGDASGWGGAPIAATGGW